eukprot:CAMPEP_0194373962 /NCGR_PEP_ID=MMETSP0174-20130528/22328_1 /TAXON_ID=216777 /ORGANISM="Proboscia alata, Strain PI-D3" /LENGTH=383 /DNA_ID=CAMNT_0039153251 /DNA_START=231 /DNA_END=1382 /DNA_ORIENTATION=-
MAQQVSAESNNGAIKNACTSINSNSRNDKSPSCSTRIAFIGNSILYFNDSPRLMEQFGSEAAVASLPSDNINNSSTTRRIVQDSCLRGGASLITILEKGNGMANKFRTDNARIIMSSCNDASDTNSSSSEIAYEYDIGVPNVTLLLSESSNNSSSWDYVIMNDYTQAPARIENRSATIQTLIKDYIPLLSIKQNNSNSFNDKTITPILLMTWAYRKPCKDSDDLGSVTEFMEKLWEGYKAYAKALDEVLLTDLSSSTKETAPRKTRIAPVGLAFYRIHQQNPTLWEKLFHTDDFHPSPHGTLLQCFVLYWTVFQKMPPKSFIFDAIDQNILWSTSRMMQPAGEDPLPRPTRQEAEYLMGVAEAVWLEVQDTSESGAEFVFNQA